jgi:3-oxoacyl-[acyl-carrier-protein] synthase II
LEKTRVVVTGLGMVSPLGLSVKQSWDAILAGKSGVKTIDMFDASAFTSQISGTVRGFDATQYVSAKEARKMELFIQYAIAASVQAIDDAGLEVTDKNAHRIGTLIGSGIGGLPMIERNCEALLQAGPRRISPFFIPGAIINMASGFLSIMKGFKGPSMSIVTACTTGTHSIGQAARMIVYGDADVMVAGGAEMATSPLGLGGFASMRALSTRNDAPEKASRPWDKDRDGFVLADGAGTLILENYEHAKKRGAKIYAELAGFGMSSDAYHMTLPDPEAKGFCASMSNALNDGKISLDAVDYINAHATATPAGDVLEAQGVRKLFGAHADKLAMSSTKSMTGHLLGAAGAVEAIFSILALRDQVAPPTINLDNPSEGCNLNLVPHVAQERTINVAMSNSFGFGGTNGTLVFKKLS